MGHDPFLDSLRRATGDPSQLATLLDAELPDDALQQIGDALLATLGQPPAPSLGPIVGRLIDALDERQWDGDTELVGALHDATGERPSVLPRLRVELDDLADALRQGEGTDNHLDLATGFVWLHTLTDSFDSDEDFDENRWLYVGGEGSHEAHRDLQRFIATIHDRRLADQLADVVQGRGAFRRFHAVLERANPAEYTRWHRYDTDLRVGHARSWLALHGYQAHPTSARTTGLA